MLSITRRRIAHKHGGVGGDHIGLRVAFGRPSGSSIEMRRPSEDATRNVSPSREVGLPRSSSLRKRVPTPVPRFRPRTGHPYQAGGGGEKDKESQYVRRVMGDGVPPPDIRDLECAGIARAADPGPMHDPIEHRPPQADDRVGHAGVFPDHGHHCMPVGQRHGTCVSSPKAASA